MRRRLPIVIGIIAFAVIVSFASGWLTGPSGAESRWSSEFGPLALWVDDDRAVSGRYPDYDGRIDATYHPDLRLIAGYWLQETSEAPCGTFRDGTDAWGRVEFVLEGSDRIVGVWSYCDGELDGTRTWNAEFLDGVHPTEVSRR